MKKGFKTISLLLALVMIMGCLAACGGVTKTPAESAPAETQTAYTGADTLVVGELNFSEKFSPFFYKTAYDGEIAVNMASVNLLDYDREGNMLLSSMDGETAAYNGIDYEYRGIANCEILQNDDGSVLYKFTMADGIVFSDGTPMTADDAIFSMYVLADPAYDGGLTFSALPIRGLTEYISGVSADIYEKYAAIAEQIHAAGADAADSDQAKAYWGEAMDAAGEKFCGEIVDYCIDEYSDMLQDVKGSEVALGMYAWGFATLDDNGVFSLNDEAGTVVDLEAAPPTLADYWELMKTTYAGDFEELNAVEAANTSLFDFAKEEFIALEGPKDAQAGGAITKIEGINKTGDLTFEVLMDEYDATAIYQFNFAVCPLHYYGDTAKFDYDNNSFGFTKGDLSGVKSKTTVPLGAGPYVFQSYENGVVTLKANEKYYKGCPKITNILFQETTDSDKLTGLISGTFDLANPSFNTSTVDAIKEYNGNDSLNGDVIQTATVDFNGYGYIGINAENVKVGDDRASQQSKDLRKGIATLLAVYRDTAVDSYYGERASVIQYPITNVSWAAPKPADEGYAIAYSKDVDGKDIFTADMSAEQKYEAALQAAIGYFKAAGYTFDETAGKFTAAPAGAEMSYEIFIGADGIGDHPTYGVLTATKEALASIGITLEINDPADANEMWNALDAGTAELWVAVWGGALDPDMYQIYHSSNAVGMGGTDSNHYSINDPQLDEMIVAARASADTAFRKATYKQCLDTILDWGVEIPVYQRQEAFIFSAQRINMDTMTPDLTTLWEWWRDIEKLEMK